ncbi:APC membrane recruitment protein 2 [Boleophthalmus pectinirostris]|uniref:APC membrane recruitment protein 2 n=1 Tax=Boleophthalmus pectinirostris TaxID=150288 RepID=UPI000A1C5C8B|nr:APC membrane recruitment protein 2 [Boleophthalmus pectinirostris]
MEVQADCLEPPTAPQTDPQPTGRINKAAFKLFGRRSTGSGMASFFSFRNKGATNMGNNGNSDNGSSLNGNGSAASVELIRSKTHDGLTDTNNDMEARPGEGHGGMEAVPVRSLSKSFSFFSFLRRGSFRSSDNGGAGFVRRGRGLKGFFSSMRWKRKEKTIEGDVEEKDGGTEKAQEIAECEKDITLTLEPPPPHHAQEDCGNTTEEPDHHASGTTTTSVTMTPQHCVALPGPSGVPDSSFPFTPTDSPLHPAIPKTKASISSLSPSLATPPLDRCSTGDPPSEPSVDRLCSLLFTDVTSLKSFDSLTGCGDIIADAEEEGPTGNGGSGTSSSSSGGGGGSSSVSVSVSASAVTAPSITCSAMTRMSPCKPPVLPQVTQVYSTSSMPSSLTARVRAPDSPQHQNGSGIVAYMGGGEEMASPEGVDDADMQGLWHMLPSTRENSPALPRSYLPTSTTPTSTYPPRSASNPPSGHLSSAGRSTERKVPQVKALGLSKIPVVGGAGAAKPPLPPSHNRHPTSPGEKELLSDEGYWDTPSATPMATPDESREQANQKITLSRDSCSGDHLYDLYNDPEEEDDQELNSTPSPSSEYKLSPTSQTTPPSSSSSSSFRSVKGNTSLSRESKIPVSSRPLSPPHSTSQETELSPPKTQAPPPARTRIPVSKLPVRRSGNTPGNQK